MVMVFNWLRRLVGDGSGPASVSDAEPEVPTEVSRTALEVAEPGVFPGFGRFEEEGATVTGKQFKKVKNEPMFSNAISKVGYTEGKHSFLLRKVSGQGIRCRLGVCLEDMALDHTPAYAVAEGSAWYYEDFSGNLCKRLGEAKPVVAHKGLPKSTSRGSEIRIGLDFRQRKVAFELPSGERGEIGGLPRGEPLHFFVSLEDPDDAWEVVDDPQWRYDYNAPFPIRSGPDAAGPQTKRSLQKGDVFRVSEERRGDDGILYLKLSNGRGWVFESKPSFGNLCVRVDTKEEKDDEGKKTEEEEEEPNLLDKVKRLGPAGLAAYGLTEGGFWALSIPTVAIGYRFATGEWPDLSDQQDLAQVLGTSFVFLNVARLAVPLRIGLAIGLAPWVDDNIIRPYFPEQWAAWRRICDDNPEECEVPELDLRR